MLLYNNSAQLVAFRVNQRADYRFDTYFGNQKFDLPHPNLGLYRCQLTDAAFCKQGATCQKVERMYGTENI
jgi:hypothetical protein